MASTRNAPDAPRGGEDDIRAHNRVFAEVTTPTPSLASLARGVWQQYTRISWRDAAVFTWAPALTRTTVLADAVAALIVTVLLVPQAMAYGLLAGLDPVVGLYSSTIPLLVYGLFTTSSQVRQRRTVHPCRGYVG